MIVSNDQRIKSTASIEQTPTNIDRNKILAISSGPKIFLENDDPENKPQGDEKDYQENKRNAKWAKYYE